MAGGARVRMSPESRREQLLDLGVSLLATRSLDEISIEMLAEEAGISRGLLYHYFGNKQDFHEAVVRRAADDLIAQTAPPVDGDPLERLHASMESYVDYVASNYEGYLSLVRGASGGNARLREIYEEARTAMTERLFTEDDGRMLEDTAAHRFLIHAWTAFCEDLVLAWVRDPQDVTHEQVVASLTAALPALVDTLT